MSKEITVVTVDDHAMIRQSVRTQIDAASGMQVVGEGACGDDVLPLVITHAPHIIFLDLHMPQTQGQTGQPFRIMPTIRTIRGIAPQTAVIILSMDVSPILIETALKRGIQGYLLKGDNATTMNLAGVVRTVHAGDPYFSETIINKMSLAKTETVLTQRQMEIMMTIAAQPGRPRADHAAELGITEGALRNQLAEINKRLGAATFLEGFVACLKQGLIALHD